MIILSQEHVITTSLLRRERHFIRRACKVPLSNYSRSDIFYQIHANSQCALLDVTETFTRVMYIGMHRGSILLGDTEVQLVTNSKYLPRRLLPAVNAVVSCYEMRAPADSSGFT